MGKASVESVIRIICPDLPSHMIQDFRKLSSCRLVEPKDQEETAETRLIFNNQISSNESVEGHLKYACSELEKVKEKLALLPKKADIDIWCTIYSESEFIGFSIEKKLLSQLAQHGVNLVFSYYEGSGR